MFVQVIRGTVDDAAGFKKQSERWQEEVAPGAIGFIGSTAGVSEDGRFIVVARFASRADAESNSARPEQDAWWKDTESYLSDVTFEESEDVEPYKGGGKDDSGFVQVMRYKLKDRAKAQELFEKMEALPDERPDMVGGVAIHSESGWVTDVLYFSSEAEARAGEAKPPSDEVAEVMSGFFSLVDGEIDYLDLREPWLFTPKG